MAALRRGPAEGVPLGAWLRRVVRNLSARWRRSRVRYDRRLRRLAAPDAALPPEEVLERAALRVVVLGPDGTPAPDVQVYVRVAGRNVAGANRRTGADGRAAFEGLPESGGVLFATPLGESKGHERWLPVAVPIRPHGEEVTLHLREARVVHGVVRAADGTPARGAVVSVLKNGDPAPPIEADPEGRFVLLLDPADVSSVRLSAATAEARSPWVDLPDGDSPVVLLLGKP